MPGQFYSAADVARVQARQSAQNAQLQYDAEMQKQKAEQNQKMAQSAQTNIDAALKTVATAAQHWVDQGKDIADPTFHDAMDPLVRGAIETSAMYSMNGLPVVTPDVLQQQFENIYTAPSRVQQATAEATAKAAGDTITTTADLNAKAAFERANPDVQAQEQAYDSQTGQFRWAPRAEIYNSGGRLKPISADSANEMELYNAYNPKEGVVMVKANKYGQVFNRDTGQPLGPGYTLLGKSSIAGTPGDFALSKTEQAKVEEESRGALATIQRAKRALKFMKSEYLTLGGQAKAALIKGQRYITGDTTKEQSQYLGDIAQFRAAAYQNVNLMIKYITGAAMFKDEQTRILAMVPNPAPVSEGGDTDIEFQRKSEELIAMSELTLRRNKFIANNGLLAPDADITKMDSAPLSLDRFQSIMNSKMDVWNEEIAQERPDATPEERSQMLLQRIDRDFPME